MKLEKNNKFSIRKFGVGAASVMIGASFMLVTNSVNADDNAVAAPAVVAQPAGEAAAEQNSVETAYEQAVAQLEDMAANVNKGHLNNTQLADFKGQLDKLKAEFADKLDKGNEYTEEAKLILAEAAKLNDAMTKLYEPYSVAKNQALESEHFKKASAELQGKVMDVFNKAKDALLPDSTVNMTADEAFALAKQFDALLDELAGAPLPQPAAPEGKDAENANKENEAPAEGNNQPAVEPGKPAEGENPEAKPDASENNPGKEETTTPEASEKPAGTENSGVAKPDTETKPDASTETGKEEVTPTNPTENEKPAGKDDDATAKPDAEEKPAVDDKTDGSTQTDEQPAVDEEAQAAELADAKKKALAVIDALPNLTEAVKNEAVKTINDAKTIKDVALALAAAKALDDKAFDAYKEQAAESLLKMDNLTAKQRVQLMKELLLAPSVADVKDVLAKAEKMNLVVKKDTSEKATNTDKNKLPKTAEANDDYALALVGLASVASALGIAKKLRQN